MEFEGSLKDNLEFGEQIKKQFGENKNDVLLLVLHEKLMLCINYLVFLRGTPSFSQNIWGFIIDMRNR